MTSDQYGQLIYSDADIIDFVMQGRSITDLDQLIVDHSVNLNQLAAVLESVPNFVEYQPLTETVEEFDQKLQSHWHMPKEYQDLDIAAHVLSLCDTQAELQRCGEELLLYQERGLFDLLRYLKYLVDTMTTHGVIWGVGRGSSVASHVLYLLKVHRINSMYYNLDIREFLR
jgi:DNA polymerase III alpha subunit